MRPLTAGSYIIRGALAGRERLRVLARAMAPTTSALLDRQGGVLIVEDIDASGSFCHPASPEFERYTELYSETARARGADPNLGRRLPGLLAGAGLAPVGVNVVQPAAVSPAGVGGDIKLLSPLTLENIADSAIAERVTTRDEVNAVLHELHRMAADTTTLMAIPRIVQSWVSSQRCPAETAAS
jgi:hypothetical protein